MLEGGQDRFKCVVEGFKRLQNDDRAPRVSEPVFDASGVSFEVTVGDLYRVPVSFAVEVTDGFTGYAGGGLDQRCLRVSWKICAVSEGVARVLAPVVLERQASSICSFAVDWDGGGVLECRAILMRDAHQDVIAAVLTEQADLAIAVFLDCEAAEAEVQG